MQREMRARLESLPRTQASFIEPMECLSVSELPEGDHWIWESLCGPPHKISAKRRTQIARLAGLANQGPRENS